MQPRSSARAARFATRRRDRFAGILVAGSIFCAALFILSPALGVFTVPTASQPVSLHIFTTPSTLVAPSGLSCTWPITAADPTSVQLDWTNGQAWSTTQIERNVNGGSYSDSGSAAAAAATSVTNTSVTSPASNQYGFKAKGVIGSWQASASSSAVTDETCKGAINELFDGSINAALNNPHDVAFDSFGNMFIADTSNHRIRCVAASGSDRCNAGNATTAGYIYTYVNTAGTSGTTDGGTAANGKLNSPKGVWVDSHDNLLIADSSNGAIRVVPAVGSTTIYGKVNMSAHSIHTIVGTIGSTGYGGDGGPPTAAAVRLNPADVATDSNDNVFIADGSNHRVRCFAANTRCGTAGNLYTFAGNGTSGWVADDVGPATTRVATPSGITVNTADSVIWTDRTNARIRMVYAGGENYNTPSTCSCTIDVGNIYTITSSGSTPWGIASDAANNLIVGDSGTSYVKVFWASSPTARYGITSPTQYTYQIVAGSGGGTYNGTGLPITGTGAAAIASPYGVAINPTDTANVYAVDNARGVVRKIDYTNGFTFTWAGVAGSSTYVADTVPAHGWEFTSLNHGTTDSSGNIYFADSGDNRIRKWIPACGCLVVAAGTGSTASNGDGSSPLLAGIKGPQGVHIDSSDNMYIAETDAHKIRMVPATPMTRFNQTNMAAGMIYTIMGNGNQCGAGSAPCGDNGTLASANRLNTPRDVIVDASGNLIVSDGLNCEIRFVAAANGTFFGAGRVVNTIYRLGGTQLSCSSGSDGIIAYNSTINVSDGMTLDGFGNLLFAEASSHKVRLIAASTANMHGQSMTVGYIYTFAGTASSGTTDGATPGTALLNNPRDVSYDSTNSAVYIADTGNDRVRKVIGAISYTVAGGGSASTGDTGPGRGAVMIDPLGVVAKASGDLYVTQNGAVDARVIKGPDP